MLISSVIGKHKMFSNIFYCGILLFFANFNGLIKCDITTTETTIKEVSNITEIPSINGTTISPTIKTALSENKTSSQKIKLLNQAVNNKKIGNLDHVLGFNGTGQRKDNLTVQTLEEVTTKSTPININTALGKDKEENPFEFDNIDITDKDTNDTLIKNNITKFEEDYHLYYNSTLIVDKNVSDMYWSNIGNLNISNLLSNSHRRATTWMLSFDFPYYGHPIRNITIATGGFLYTGDYVHSWLASTQYIAPLMANFDTSLSNNSYVKFRDDGNSFIVVWENVSLQDRHDVMPFTFSATLNKTGDITFAYKNIPLDLESIQDDKHPVKVGLSDAYIIDKTIFKTKQKTIYEYHRVNFGGPHVQNNTIITLKALPTCSLMTDCSSCLKEIVQFKCTWCPTLNRCSTGIDRKRQDWIQKGCEKTQIQDAETCPAIGQKGNNADETTDNSNVYHTFSTTSTPQITIKTDTTVSQVDDHVNKVKFESLDEKTSSNSLLVVVLVIFSILFSCGIWVLYAYRNPHTKSGQLLIRYRPNKWSWRRGEARYTAATIHM